MTKAEFIEKICSKVDGLSKTRSEEILNATVDALREALVSGEALTLTGFGSFKVSTSAARKGRNPRTGDPIEIPERKIVKFSASTVLKDALNK